MPTSVQPPLAYTKLLNSADHASSPDELLAILHSALEHPQIMTFNGFLRLDGVRALSMQSTPGTRPHTYLILLQLFSTRGLSHLLTLLTVPPMGSDEDPDLPLVRAQLLEVMTRKMFQKLQALTLLSALEVYLLQPQILPEHTTQRAHYDVQALHHTFPRVTLTYLSQEVNLAHNVVFSSWNSTPHKQPKTALQLIAALVQAKALECSLSTNGQVGFVEVHNIYPRDIAIGNEHAALETILQKCQKSDNNENEMDLLVSKMGELLQATHARIQFYNKNQ